MDPTPVATQPTLLLWMYQSLGLWYSVLLPLTSLLSFVLVLVLVVWGRGPWAAGALVLVVPLPLLVGAFGALQGAISSLSVIAMSSTPPRPGEVSAGVATALFAPLVGLTLMAPGLALAILGAAWRSLTARRET